MSSSLCQCCRRVAGALLSMFFWSAFSLSLKPHLSRERESIINGTLVKTPSEKYSYHALPTTGSSSDTWLGCGASIISPTFGLSAAHCFGGGLDPCSGPHHIALWLGDLYLANNFDIKAAAEGQSARVEAEVLCHPEFDGKCSHGHDIVLLKLKQALPAWVKPVPLDLSDSPSAGDVTLDMGYGIAESSVDSALIDDLTNSHTLRKVSLSIISDSQAECARVYEGGYGCSDDFSEGKASNLDQQICAGALDGQERDTCSGDSGSPMLNAAGAQIGIVSYGGGPGEQMRGPQRMCGAPDYAGVYTRVAAFKDFIESHVNDLA